jgi:chlorobactene glucosyltransferase
MTALSVVLSVLCGFTLAVWLSRHAMIFLEKRQGFILTQEYGKCQADQQPHISVVVAAKDEEAVIRTCVSSMLEQNYPNFDLTVANDRSGDRTGQIVAELAKEDSRLRLVNIQTLPEGWCGKSNAMQQAIAQTRGEWICMIDADCRQTSPRSLSSAIAYAQDQKADMLSVLPTLEMKGFWENIVQPVCGGIMIIWFNPARVNSDRRKEAYANGAFMLIRRGAYQAVGTHEAIKDRINEDMHLAQRIKQAGLRLRVVRNNGLYVVRMYTSLRQIVRGWGRIFFGTFGSFRRIVISLAVLTVMGLMPYVSLALAGAALAAGVAAASFWRVTLVLAGLAVLAQLTVIYRFYGLVGARQRLFWSYPIGCAVGMVCLGVSLSKLRKGAAITWRGTSYAKK